MPRIKKSGKRLMALPGRLRAAIIAAKQIRPAPTAGFRKGGDHRPFETTVVKN